jgi:hypothetical protein
MFRGEVGAGICVTQLDIKGNTMAMQNAARALVAAVSLIASAAHADFYQFNGTLDNGYAVQGVFETKASAPVSFIESNPSFPKAPFATQYVEYASLTVFRFGSALGSGSSISAGVSYDPFYYTAFDSSTLALSALDIQTRGMDMGPTPYYFISNGVAPDYTTVAYGSTNFNLFLFDPANSSATFLGSTSALAVTAIPAPAGLFAFVLLPVARRRRR